MKKWVKISLIILGTLIIIFGIWIIINIFSPIIGPNFPEINRDLLKSLQEEIDGNSSILIAILPLDRKIMLEQGSNNGGFAFAVKNNNSEDSRFVYTIKTDSSLNQDCNSLTIKEANSWIFVSIGTINILGESISGRELVLFNIPEDAPLCTIPYILNVTNEYTNESFTDTVYVTITGD